MRHRKIDPPDDRAEGLCLKVPYNTELINSSGVSIHFWFGDVEPSPDVLDALERTARRNRDIVGMTYSSGQPASFWARQDMD